MKAHADSRETTFCWSSLEYPAPYLEFARDNKELFAALLANSGALELDRVYARMLEHVISPVLERFDAAAGDRAFATSAISLRRTLRVSFSSRVRLSADGRRARQRPAST